MMSNWKKIVFILAMLLPAMTAQAEDASSWDDWKMRTELVLDAERGKRPMHSIETVQPLYSAVSRKNTLLMQLRAAKEDRFAERHTIYNFGLGYRNLFADNDAMVGIKLFYDLDDEYGVSRGSIGADLSWKVLDLYANKYYGLGDWKPTNRGATEKSLNGYDVDLAVQVPYMPWAKLHAMHYQWDREPAFENITGRKLSLEGALTLRWTVEIGRHIVDNRPVNDNFMMLRYRWAGSVREHQNANNNFWASSAFEMREMRDHTLERMRRSNSIAVERIEP